MIKTVLTGMAAMMGISTGSMPSELVPNAASIYDFQMKNIDGKEVSLKKYEGKVILVVNVASKCGLTPQYEGLEALYEKYKSKGLVILGFPANDFLSQEPGTDAEIREFCTTKYKVTFPMFSKITVLGDNTHDLYRWLIEQSGDKNPIEWNFAKFIVDRTGTKVFRFSPKAKPQSEAVVKQIEALLEAK